MHILGGSPEILLRTFEVTQKFNSDHYFLATALTCLVYLLPDLSSLLNHSELALHLLPQMAAVSTSCTYPLGSSSELSMSRQSSESDEMRRSDSYFVMLTEVAGETSSGSLRFQDWLEARDKQCDKA